MLATSFKDAEQIRSGNLLSLPASLNLDGWRLAWSSPLDADRHRNTQYAL